MNQNIYLECPVKDIVSLSSLFTFSRRRFPVGYIFKGESHDFYEIVCVVNGTVRITADKKVYLLSAGKLIIHSPNEFHAIWSGTDSDPETIIFSFRAENFPILSQTTFSLSETQVSTLIKIYEEAEQAFIINGTNVCSVRAGNEKEASIVIKKLELFILEILSFEQIEKKNYLSIGTENYYQIVSVLEKNISSALTLQQIAELCNVSIPTVEKTIYKYSGCGAMAYYNNLKMKEAAKLLLNGASVKEAALYVGFANQNYFSVVFKKHMGVAPSKFAASHK